MPRFNIIFLYLTLSAVNGMAPLAIALLLSVPGMIALLMGGLVTLASFSLICLICLGGAMKEAVTESETNSLGRDFKKAAIYH